MSNLQRPSPSAEGHHGEMSSPSPNYSLSDWIAHVAPQLDRSNRTAFEAIAKQFNTQGFAVGTPTEFLRRAGIRTFNNVTYSIRYLQCRGVIARRGKNRFWAAPWAPPLFSTTAAQAKVVGAQRARILARDGNACLACGSTKRLSVDHIIAWSVGGSNDDSNLQILCGPCNTRKADRTQEEFVRLSHNAGIQLLEGFA